MEKWIILYKIYENGKIFTLMWVFLLYSWKIIKKSISNIRRSKVTDYAALNKGTPY